MVELDAFTRLKLVRGCQGYACSVWSYDKAFTNACGAQKQRPFHGGFWSGTRHSFLFML